MRWRFTGADPVDDFGLGRINPGDELDFDGPPGDARWTPAAAALADDPGPIPTDLRPAAARPARLRSIWARQRAISSSRAAIRSSSSATA